MAALDEHNTRRLFVDYEGPMGKRTMQFRLNDATPIATGTAAVYDFLSEITPFVYSSVVFTALRYAAKGTNVSNPQPWVQVAGGAAGTLQQQDYPRYVDWVGRSEDGRRVRLFIYGSTSALTPDFRIGTLESGLADAGVSYLNSSASPFVTISGLRPVWKPYGNQGLNSYHQRKRREVA